MQEITTPGYRVAYNINPSLRAINGTDSNDNPTGGSVGLIVRNVNTDNLEALRILWQNGPRGLEDGTLTEPNGAFVEDVLWAALQRLEFFNSNRKFMCRANSLAITHIEQALQALKDRQLERSHRGVEGKHEA